MTAKETQKLATKWAKSMNKNNKDLKKDTKTGIYMQKRAV